MTMRVKSLFLSAALAAMILPVAAQDSNSAATEPPVKDKNTIGERKENQQDRIGRGVGNGSLTAGEAARLEKKEKALNAETREMRADGKLTPAERARVTRQQNRLSHQIYRQKHDAQGRDLGGPPRKAPTEVGRREERQQDRIGRGVDNGSLTAGEASHLENREARINNEIKTDRADNGGKLTGQEKAQINRQQNRVSHNIYRAKHNNNRHR